MGRREFTEVSCVLCNRASRAFCLSLCPLEVHQASSFQHSLKHFVTSSLENTSGFFSALARGRSSRRFTWCPAATRCPQQGISRHLVSRGVVNLRGPVLGQYLAQTCTSLAPARVHGRVHLPRMLFPAFAQVTALKMAPLAGFSSSGLRGVRAYRGWFRLSHSHTAGKILGQLTELRLLLVLDLRVRCGAGGSGGVAVPFVRDSKRNVQTWQARKKNERQKSKPSLPRSRRKDPSQQHNSHAS